jgi:hypothetical protein
MKIIKLQHQMVMDRKNREFDYFSFMVARHPVPIKE